MRPEAQHHRDMKTLSVHRKLSASDGQNVRQREEENPRVKCRDCGAFGHKARSSRCPIKCWQGAMAPQPLGSKKDEENQDSRETQRPHNSGSISHSERQKEQTKRPEEQHRKAYFQSFPMQPPRRIEQSQHATRLRPNHRNDQRTVPDPIQTSQPLVVTSEENSMCPAVPPRKSPERTFTSLPGKCGVQNPAVRGIQKPVLRKNEEGKPAFERMIPEFHSLQECQDASRIHLKGQELHPPFPTQVPDGKAQPSLCPLINTSGQFVNHNIWTPGKRQSELSKKLCRNPAKVPRVNSPEANEHSSGCPSSQALQALPFLPQVSPKVQSKIPANVPSSVQQLPHHRGHRHSSQPCFESHQPSSSSSPVPRPPIRIVFTRVGNDCWSTRLVSPSSVHSPEKQALPAEKETFLQKSEGPRTQVPVTVLYEDLQVSSSSEESDWE